MMWGGRIRVISTHNGADNPFADLVNDIRAGRLSYSLHRTTLDDALAAGLYRAICRETGREWSKEAEQVWRQDLIEQYRDGAEEELFVIPSHGGGVFLPAELIESRMRDGIPVLKAKGGTAYQELEPSIDRQLRLLDSQLITCFGVDFGRSGDISAFWFFQIQQNLVRRTAFVIELREVPHEVQRAILFRALDGCPRLISGVMDAAGNGSWLAEVKGLKYGGTREQPGRIELLMLNLEWYRDQMPKLKRAFEEAMIELPRNDDVLADFRLIRMEKGVAKVPDVRIKDTAGGFRHGDSAIACALAYYASYRNQEVYEYTPVRPKRSSRDFLTRGGDDEESSRGLAAQLNAVFGRARFGRGTW